MIKIDRIIFGDNQFFGVNHLSNEKGIAKEIYFQDINNILKVIRWAKEYGAQGIMFSTHPRISEICDAIRKDEVLKNGFNIYPNIPYIAKYVREANEKGPIGMLTDILSRITFKDKMGLLVRGGKNIFSKDLIEIIKILIDVEMSYFSGLSVKAIFLHNVLVDLALGLDIPEIFEVFYNYITKKYRVVPGFGTLNLVRLLDVLEKIGIQEPLVMTSFNSKGLYMNPSKKDYEECCQNRKFQLLANGVLASGALKPKEAFDYLFNFKQDASVVFGASSKKHIEETTLILKES